MFVIFTTIKVILENLRIVNKKSLIRSSGELDNTIIAFSTDNGGVPYAGALNYPLRYT